MYLAVDIGGTKTLLAVFSEDGKIVERVKFETPHNYKDFLGTLENYVAEMTTKEYSGCCVAIPGLLDRKQGIVVALGNLPWVNKPIRDDVAKILGTTPIIIENDSRLAGLGAAQPFKNEFNNIFYLTISTGIGGALITDGKIVEPLQDIEAGKIPVYYEGKLQTWEDFASGQAIVKKYHKRASEIDDDKTWREIAESIAYGLAIVSSIIQPQVIVFGGGAGQFADKFIPHVAEYMDKILHPVARRPALRVAQNPEEVVIYGCFELAKQYAKLIKRLQADFPNVSFVEAEIFSWSPRKI